MRGFCIECLQGKGSAMEHKLRLDQNDLEKIVSEHLGIDINFCRWHISKACDQREQDSVVFEADLGSSILEKVKKKPNIINRGVSSEH